MVGEGDEEQDGELSSPSSAEGLGIETGRGHVTRVDWEARTSLETSARRRPVAVARGNRCLGYNFVPMRDCFVMEFCCLCMAANWKAQTAG
jgi:hypothetical protein